MQEQARIVIIGGGIVGCSTAYHLMKLGWRDMVMVEQGPLFPNWGSTSHAPGLMFQHNNSKSVCQLAQWAIELYKEIGAHTPVASFFQVGSLEIAATRERAEDLKRKIGNCRSWGLEAQLIGPTEMKRLVPIMNVDDLISAFYVPSDADVKAAVLSETMVRLCKEKGALTVHERTAVTGIEVEGGRVRSVTTTQGRIKADVVLCAAGIWGPAIGKMAGVGIPLTPMQHLYVRTEPLKELKGETLELRHPVIREQDRDLYYRQHTEAYGFGSYRHDPLPVNVEDIPRRDNAAMLAFTPEHMAESFKDAHHRFPAMAAAGMAQSFNGLFSFTPDLQSILGEARGVRGFWVAEAVWVTHGGGVGRVMAEWIAEGLPSIDLREMDINRFHPHAYERGYIRARSNRQYVEVYDIIHPLEQSGVMRNLRVSPFHSRQAALGAEFFESAGWERPQWFKSNEQLLAGAAFPVRKGWAAKNWSPVIGAEHLACRERVGMFDLTAFAKFEVTGPGALAFLQRMAANQMDRPIGSVTYTAMLTERGGIKCDLTVTRWGAERFWVVTGGSMGLHDLAWLRAHAPAEGVEIRDVTSAYCCIGVWGPRARELVQALSEDDLSNAGFGYLTARRIFVGGVPVIAVRISYAGELGWEIYAPPEYGLRLWDVLWAAGEKHGVAAVGGGAFDSLRLEKGYRLWGAEIHTEYNPYEAGLGFAVILEKGEFMGREALRAIKAAGVKRRLCCLTLADPSVALMGKEPIFDGERVLGYVTSANCGYSVGKSIAYGYLPLTHAVAGTAVEVYYFGERHAAHVTKEPLYDPANEKLKM